MAGGVQALEAQPRVRLESRDGRPLAGGDLRVLAALLRRPRMASRVAVLNLRCGRPGPACDSLGGRGGGEG